MKLSNFFPILSTFFILLCQDFLFFFFTTRFFISDINKEDTQVLNCHQVRCTTCPGTTLITMWKKIPEQGNQIIIFFFLISGGLTCPVTWWRRGRKQVRSWGRWCLLARTAGRKPAPSSLWGWTATNCGWRCHPHWVPSGPNQSTCHL